MRCDREIQATVQSVNVCASVIDDAYEDRCSVDGDRSPGWYSISLSVPI